MSLEPELDMDYCGQTPVTFRHKLESITKDVQTRKEIRKQHSEEFNNRLNYLVSRYEAMLSARLRRLSDEGIYLDFEEIRSRAKRVKAEREKELYRVSDSNASERHYLMPKREPVPELKLELSFHSQSSKKATRFSISSDDPPKDEPRRRKRSKGSPISKQKFRNFSSKVINIQRLTTRRHTLSVVPINLSRDPLLPRILTTESIDNLDKNNDSQLAKGRHKSANPRIPPVRDNANLEDILQGSVDGKLKLKRAVRKLGTLRHFQKIC